MIGRIQSGLWNSHLSYEKTSLNQKKFNQISFNGDEFVNSNHRPVKHDRPKGIMIADPFTSKTGISTVLNTLEHGISQYIDQENYDQARTLYNFILFCKLKTLGFSHPDVGHTSNDLGDLSLDEKKYDEAELWYKQGLYIFTVNEDPLNTARTCGKLACLYQREKDTDEEEEMLTEALENFDKTQSKETLEAVEIMGKLKEIKKSQGNLEEAKKLSQRILSIMIKELGEDHPGVEFARKETTDLDSKTE